MTSDSDDLEQQLREKVKSRRELGDLEEQLGQNLKLRRELGTKIAKARDRNAKDRLGWALYWILLALAGIWVFIWLWMLHGGVFGLETAGVEHAIEVFMRNPLGQLAFMGIPVLMFYSLGRAIRYVLSGSRPNEELAVLASLCRLGHWLFGISQLGELQDFHSSALDTHGR